MEVEAATALELKAARTRKPKSGAKRPRKPKVAEFIELQPSEPAPVEEPTGSVYGWPIKDGFSRIMIFSDHNDGNKVTYVRVMLGDHAPVMLAKNKMHTLPNGLVNIILDTEQEYPVDDLSNEMKPVRYFEKGPRFPHSEPIPATAKEYVAYRQTQEKLPHPNKLSKN